MEKLLRVAEMRDLESQVSNGKITYSRMVEIINEKHFIKLVEIRQELKDKKECEHHLVRNGQFIKCIKCREKHHIYNK